MKVLVALIFFLGLLPSAHAQLTCADLDGASIFSSEDAPVYLGFMGNAFASDSIFNRFGTYGNEFSTSSVRNQFGRYGSSSSMFSAQNSFAVRPPRIIRDGVFIAYLSNNTSLTFRAVSLAAIDGACQFVSASPARFYATSPQSAPPPPPSEASAEAAFSGMWFNPEQDGHGLSIAVHSPENVSIFWYTYDPFGNPLWILGIGRFVGQKIVADVLYFDGMVFGDWNPADRRMLVWGALEVEFKSCNTARMTYSSDLQYPSGERFGEGEMNLERLASIDGLECR